MTAGGQRPEPRPSHIYTTPSRHNQGTEQLSAVVECVIFCHPSLHRVGLWLSCSPCFWPKFITLLGNFNTSHDGCLTTRQL